MSADKASHFTYSERTSEAQQLSKLVNLTVVLRWH